MIKKIRRYSIRVIEYQDGSFSATLSWKQAGFRVRAEANTLRQAFVGFANKLKRVKASDLEEIWEGEYA